MPSGKGTKAGVPSRSASILRSTDGIDHELVDAVVERLIDVCAATIAAAHACTEQTALSPDTAAARLDMSKGAVLDFVKAGVIPSVRLSPRIIRIPARWIDEQLASAGRGRPSAIKGKSRVRKAAAARSARTRKARSR